MSNGCKQVIPFLYIKDALEKTWANILEMFENHLFHEPHFSLLSIQDASILSKRNRRRNSIREEEKNELSRRRETKMLEKGIGENDQEKEVMSFLHVMVLEI